MILSAKREIVILNGALSRSLGQFNFTEIKSLIFTV